MKKLILVLFGTAMLTVGCKKGAQDVNSAKEGADLYGRDRADGAGTDGTNSARKEVAQGDMRKLLLTLKRVHFAFDSTDLNDDAKDALTNAAATLVNLPEVELYVDGHTDELGTTEYNMSLGERRSTAVIKYLVAQGVEKTRLKMVSFGEEKPLVSGNGEMANAENRRVDFRLIKGDVEFVLEDSPPVLGDKKAESDNGEQ